MMEVKDYLDGFGPGDELLDQTVDILSYLLCNKSHSMISLQRLHVNDSMEEVAYHNKRVIG